MRVDSLDEWWILNYHHSTEVALRTLTFGHVELDERWALTTAVFPGASEVSQKALNTTSYDRLNTAVPILQLYSDEFTRGECAFVPELVAVLCFTI
ncbi:hypothetical protein F2P79_011598 [Pimephales promelas]|nr:hypothetical protein F2P79_011598 [Pimephales promelas]